MVVRLSVEDLTVTNITTGAFFASELGKEFFFQKNNTFWYSFYSKSLAILKKYKFSVSKKPIFSKETKVLNVLGNLTISVAFFGKSGTIWGKRERNWQTSGKNTLLWVLWEAAVMYLFIQFIKLPWRIWNCFSIFEVLLSSFLKSFFGNVTGYIAVNQCVFQIRQNKKSVEKLEMALPYRWLSHFVTGHFNLFLFVLFKRHLNHFLLLALSPCPCSLPLELYAQPRLSAKKFEALKLVVGK